MTINAYEFPTVAEAFQYWYASGEDRVIRLDGKFLVTTEEACYRLERAGVEFAYLHDYKMADGSSRTISVPVN